MQNYAEQLLGEKQKTSKKDYAALVLDEPKKKAPSATHSSDGVPLFAADDPRGSARNEEIRNHKTEQTLTNNSLTRVASHSADRFNETEFGLSPETIETPDTGIPAIDMTNDVIMKRIADPAFRVLQLLGATGEAGISAIMQIAREAKLPEESVNRFENDALAMFEILGHGAGTRLPKAITRTKSLDQATEAAKDTANKILDPHGVDARRLANENAIVNDAESLPVPVRLSKGDVNQNLKQQQFEEDALKGLEGRKAQETAAEFRQQQNTDINKNVEAIQEGFTNNAALTREEQGLGLLSAQKEVKRQAKTAKQEISAAYKEAGERGASVDGAIIGNYFKGVRKELELEGFDIEEMSKLQKSLSDFEGVTGDVTTSIQKLELFRKRINKRIANDGSPEDAALIRLKGSYDEFMDELVDQALIHGDEGAMAAFKNARGLRIDYQNKFKADRIIKKITEEDLEPEELVSLIFNAGQSGFKTGSGRVMKGLKKILGENSPAFQQIKEEAFIRLISNQGETFSGAKFDSALSKALERNGTVMRNVFTNEEIALLRRFGRVVKAATVKQSGVVNFSNSANKFFSRASKNLPFIEPLMKALSAGQSTKKAASSFGGGQDSSQIINLIRDNREGFKELVIMGMGAKDAEVVREAQQRNVR